MKISREELNLLVDGSRKEFIEMSADSCLVGTFQALSMSDRIALSWLEGTIQLLNRKGFLNTLDLEIELYQPDSTTMTDGYDSSVDMEEEAKQT